jgi:hypothetical protein
LAFHPIKWDLLPCLIIKWVMDSAPALLPAILAPSPNACPKYDRDAQYGDWIDADRDCQNTRAEVLIRGSLKAVSFRATNPCLVDSGLWFDPYSGDTLLAAADLQIEHVVPVSEAHKSGAWAWTQAQRKLFYNDLDSAYHLIPIIGSVNASKGDKDPAEWLPPATGYRREYALNWVKIKTRWMLTADAKELSTLHMLIGDTVIAYPAEAPEDICTETGPVAISEGRSAPLRPIRATIDLPWDLNGKWRAIAR